MVAEFDPRFRRPSHRAQGFFVQCSTPPKNLAKAGKSDWMPTAGWSLGFRTPTKEPPVLLHMWLWTTRFKGCNSIETLDFRTCRDINPFYVRIICIIIRKCMPDCYSNYPYPLHGSSQLPSHTDEASHRQHGRACCGNEEAASTFFPQQSSLLVLASECF